MMNMKRMLLSPVRTTVRNPPRWHGPPIALSRYSGIHQDSFDYPPLYLRSQQRAFIRPTGVRCYQGNSRDNDPPSHHEDTRDTTIQSKKSRSRQALDRFIPRKAAVQLTERSRAFFQKLLASPPRPNIVGILLNLDQSQTGEPRMVYTFSFVTDADLDEGAEGVSLEVDENGQPKSPSESWNDNLPKLYVHPNAFLKVLGATVDVDPDTNSPVLFDREGNLMDPNE